MPAPTRSVRPPATSHQLVKAWSRDWLQGTPCAPPCYMGVTPGEMAPAEALAFLQATYPDFTFVDRQEQPGGPHVIITDWMHPANALEVPLGSSTMEAFYATEPPLGSTAPPDTIISIVVDSFYYMPSFAEVIAAYGQPSHALAIEKSTDFAVVYLEQGFMLDFELGIEQRSMGQLGPETLQLTGVRFFVPTIAGFDAAAPTFSDQELAHPSALLVPWVGPKAFSYYCRPAQPDPTARC